MPRLRYYTLLANSSLCMYLLEGEGHESNFRQSCLTRRFEPDARKTRAPHPERLGGAAATAMASDAQDEDRR